MKTIEVKLKSNNYYNLIIGNDIIDKISLKKFIPTDVNLIVVTNETIYKIYGEKLNKYLIKNNCNVKFIFTKDGEQYKSKNQYLQLLEEIHKAASGKKIYIIVFGGGVVGDLAGFVAGTYKRGVPYIYIPTTLLAQVDCSIGGKVGIDIPEGKNLIGMFYQPKLVIIDINFLSTLPKKEVLSGLAEVIKYGIGFDKDLFDSLVNNISSFQNNMTYKNQIIEKCVKIKADIIEEDEKDDIEGKKKRVKLNYGHTIGHAIESATNYIKYTHGEAIAIGMVCAARIANKLELLDIKSLQKIENLIKKSGLPKYIEHCDTNSILKHMAFDKKFISGVNNFVLPTKIGNVILQENVPETIITSSIESLLNKHQQKNVTIHPKKPIIHNNLTAQI